jgi:nucleoid-associated protein YgaU
MSSTAIALTSAGTSGKAAGGGRPTLTRAVLELYDAQPAGGGGKPGSSRGQIPFQFNPKELSIQKSAKWERKPAKGAKKAGPPEFTGADPCKMTLEMFFDATDTLDGSVVQRVEQLFSCCVPTEESLAQKKGSPPLVVLHWGKVTSFSAFVTSVQAKYTLFTPDGTPIRATCSISLEEMPGDPPGQNPTSGSLQARAMHTVVSGDTLASIAYREYGNPAMWRPLAAFNQIDDPLRLPDGISLLVPSADELLSLDQAGG